MSVLAGVSEQDVAALTLLRVLLAQFGLLGREPATYSLKEINGRLTIGIADPFRMLLLADPLLTQLGVSVHRAESLDTCLDNTRILAPPDERDPIALIRARQLRELFSATTVFIELMGSVRASQGAETPIAQFVRTSGGYWPNMTSQTPAIVGIKQCVIDSQEQADITVALDRLRGVLHHSGVLPGGGFVAVP